MLAKCARASSSSCCKHWVRSSPRWMASCFSDWPFRWKFMKLRSNWAELTPLKDPAAAKMPAAASRPIHSSFQSSQSRVSELRNAFVVTLHGPRLLQLRLALCGHGDVFFFSFHIVIQMGLMLDSNSAAAKGQLISKRLLVSSILPKENEKIRLYY